MSKYKKVYAVIDNYHENRFPVIAVCNTEDAAEKYIADRIKEDKQKEPSNNFNRVCAERHIYTKRGKIIYE